jgi:TRAP-type C4-dicarboxylate transport system permease large subunit
MDSPSPSPAGRPGAARPTGETELQRWQRNFNELLQELRVAQTGVQILFAFLLILAFTPGFDATEPFARWVYLVALLSAAAATALLIGPVAYHRLVFRRSQKPELVISAHRMAYAGLMLVVVSMVSAVLLATDEVLDRLAAVVVSAATGVVFVLLWVVLPLLRRR